ncbi:MAG TPA: hypothetical protein VLJ42_06270 [Solirubrobacteraceae bacterium]|nr:hypothetical protein [Solirubrobacteraceae bacterium]
MDAKRSQYGLLVSALGAITLAVSVFLPWYALSFTATGIAYFQQLSSQLVSRLGSTALTGYFSQLQGKLNGLAGHHVAALSAHQVLKHVNVLLLIVAGVAILITLIPLARPDTFLTEGNGGLIALLGAVATACVVYRMVSPPNPAANFISLSLREGAWLALLGSLAMVVGGLWPRDLGLSMTPRVRGGDAWSELSGWTPEV